MGNNLQADRKMSKTETKQPLRRTANTNIILFIVLSLFMGELFRLQMSSFEVFDSSGLVGLGRTLILIWCVCLMIILMRIEKLEIRTELILVSGWLIIMTFQSLMETVVVGKLDIINLLSMNTAPMLFIAFYICSDSIDIYDCAHIMITPILLVIFMCLLAGINLVKQGGIYSQQNLAYYPLLCVPWILIFKSKWLKGSLLLTVLLIVTFSLKRTAAIAIGMMVLGWGVHYAKEFKKLNIKRLLNICLWIFIISGFIYAGNDFLENRFYVRMMASVEDGGSGRLEIYKEVLGRVRSASPEELIGGHGHNAVQRVTVNNLSAHNDVIEVLYDYGILGLTIYGMIWIGLFRFSLQLMRDRDPMSLPFLISVLLFSTMSTLSHLVIYPSYFLMLVSFWGVLMGRRNGGIRRMMPQ